MAVQVVLPDERLATCSCGVQVRFRHADIDLFHNTTAGVKEVDEFVTCPCCGKKIFV